MRGPRIDTPGEPLPINPPEYWSDCEECEFEIEPDDWVGTSEWETE